MNEQDRYNHEIYWLERYEGAPVSLQFVGRSDFDGNAMKVLEMVKNAIRRSQGSEIWYQGRHFQSLNLGNITEAQKGLTAKRMEQESRNME
jgi:hypothetical protein